MSLLSVSAFSTLNASVSFNARSALSAALREDLGSEGSAVNVDLDASFLVQVALFVLLLLILKPLLFEPMLKLFEEREKRIEGTRLAAAKEDERSGKALAKYESLLAKAREEAAAERDALRAEGLKKEAEIMARVRAMTAATVEQGRAGIASEAASARTALGAEATALGRAMASRVLGREVQS